MQFISSPNNTNVDGSHGPVQAFGRFGIGQSFEITQKYGQSVFIGKAFDFFMKQYAQIVFLGSFRNCNRIIRKFGEGTHGMASMSGCSPLREPPSDGMQPSGNSLFLRDRTGRAGQPHKYRLSDVFRRMMISQNAVASAQHQAGVAPNKTFKGPVIARFNVSLHKIGIRRPIIGGPQ